MVINESAKAKPHYNAAEIVNQSDQGSGHDEIALRNENMNMEEEKKEGNVPKNDHHRR